MSARCFFEDCPFDDGVISDPNAATVCRRTLGWEAKALDPRRRGGSDVLDRQPTGDLAHRICVERWKNGRGGQEALL